MTDDAPLLDPDRMYRRVLEAGERWADCKAAYEALDDVTKTVLADVAGNLQGETRTEAGQRALRSEAYRNHLASVAAARKEYLLSQVRYDSLRMLVDLRRSIEATRRAEMAL